MDGPAIAEPAKGGSRTYTIALTGAAEVPGPGDTDGAGTAEVTVDVPDKKVCYELTVSGIEPATMAHIHLGAAGAGGGVVVSLEAPTDGSSEGCVEDIDAKLAAQLLARPSQYYVNVHNTAFPDGALRGQLG